MLELNWKLCCSLAFNSDIWSLIEMLLRLSWICIKVQTFVTLEEPFMERSWSLLCELRTTDPVSWLNSLCKLSKLVLLFGKDIFCEKLFCISNFILDDYFNKRSITSTVDFKTTIGLNTYYIAEIKITKQIEDKAVFQYYSEMW